MYVKRLYVAVLTTVTTIFLSSSLWAAPDKPFPQFQHKSGVPLPLISEQECTIATKYVSWVNKYVKPYSEVSGALMIEGHITGELDWPGVTGLSASEHTGYGMILSALMDGYQRLDNPVCQAGTLPVNYQPKEIFDGLFKLYQALPSNCGGSKLMSWVVPDDLGGGSHLTCSATDGDMDIAYGLILAHKQWGDAAYKTAAVAMLKDIRDNDISDNGLILLGNWGQTGVYRTKTRSSDWMLGHLSAFEEYLDDPIWGDVRDTTLDALTDVSNGTTGLMPDFIDYNGTTGRALGPVFLCEHFPTQHFSENASRTPWRLAVDYLHNNDTTSRAQLRKIADWVKDKIKDGSSYEWDDVRDTYKLNGDNFSWNSIPIRDEEMGVDCTYSADNLAEGLSKGKNRDRLNFVGPLLTALIADGTGNSNSSALTQGWLYLMSAENSGSDDYFGDSVRLLSMHTIGRTWWDPAKAYADSKVYNVNKGTNYTSLQSAIDSANSNDRLIVGRAASMSSGITVNKNGLVIQGSANGSSRSSFTGSGSGTAITINAGVENVVISGFDIQDYDKGVLNYGTNTVVNDILFKTDLYGFQHRGVGGEVKNSEFIPQGNGASGVYVVARSGVDLLVHRNKFRGGNYGVNLEGRTLVYNNTFDDIDYALAIYTGSVNSQFRNNIIVNGYRGIYVSGSPGTLGFRSNLLHNNNVNSMPSGYSDPDIVFADPGLDADLVPSTAAAINNGVHISGGYTGSVADNLPDIGAVEVLSESSSSNTNLIQNGDFSDGFDYWFTWTANGGSASFNASAGYIFADIYAGGSERWSVAVAQDSFTVTQGKSYRVSFRARASSSRNLQVLVGMNEDPWTVYSAEEQFNLSSSWQTYSFDFTMSYPTDVWSQLEFDMGQSARDVYIDDVTLIELP